MASDVCILYIQERRNGNGTGAPLHMKSKLPYGNKRRANYNKASKLMANSVGRKEHTYLINARAYISDNGEKSKV